MNIDYMKQEEKIFPVIRNRENFILREIPNHHPSSAKYIQYWREQKKRCIEGFWGQDTVDPLDKGSWRFMPPNLYFYINFGTILHKPPDAPRSASKNRIRPYLRDVEWAFFYNFIEARGFSGFSDDDEYSCCSDLLEHEDGELPIELIHKSCIKSDGSLKTYVKPRDYIRKLWDKPVGIPLYFNHAKNLMLLGSRGFGKLLEENEPLRTPDGWTPMKDICEGDAVYGSDGKLANVTWKSDLQEDMKMYKLTLRDGRTINACEDHLWNVFDKEKYKSDSAGKRVLSTKELVETYRNKRVDSKHKAKYGEIKYIYEYRYSLPTMKAIDEPDKEGLVLDPYLLGLILGDGHIASNGVSMTTMDKEIEDSFRDLIPNGYKIGKIQKKKNNKAWSFKIAKEVINSHQPTFSDLIKDLGFLDKLSHEKFIPANYMYSSYNTKLSLLQGLVDSDGYVTKNHIEICTSSKQMAEDILSLSRSIGINGTTAVKKTHYKKDWKKILCRDSYRVWLYTDKKISRLERKQDNTKHTKSKAGQSRYSKTFITNIEPIENSRGYCISVDNEDNTYIANNYIVTHNSYSVGVGVILHEILFDSAKEYTKESIENPSVAEVFVGSAISSKSSDLLAKTYDAYVNLPGVWAKGTEDEIPSPFYKDMSGSLRPNNMKAPWRHEYDKKVAGKWQKFGSKSHVYHGIWTSENPEAAAGTRPAIIVVEEVGLVANLLTIHGSNSAAQMTDGTDKFGSSIYIGCVCEGTKVWDNYGRLINIEDLVKDNGIIGYDANGALKQDIEVIKDPATKKCYRIELEGNDFLECSEDHPILMSKSDFNKNIDWETYRLCTFREAKNIKAGDQLGLISGVEVFGTKSEKDARLLGLLIGDGYIGGSTAELSVDSEDISEFVRQNYDVSLKRSFKTKKGSNYYCYNIKGFNNNLREAEIKGQVKMDKTLPKNVDEYDKASLSNLIGGYFDADGSVRIGPNGYPQITLTSISQDLLESVKYRLIKFGVESSIYKEKITGGKASYGSREFKYVLYVVRFNSVLNFADNIKFLNKSKQDVLNRIYDRDQIKKYRTTNRLLYVGGDHGNFFEDSSIVDGINFRRVKSIEYIGEKTVYNLTAGGSHTYLANNIITHNTSGNIEKIVESEIIFRDPDSYDMLSFNDDLEGSGNIGWFMSAIYADGKYKDENGNTMVAEAEANYLKRREKLKKARSRTALDLEMMNYPILPSEMFLNVGSNGFPISDIKARYAEILSDKKILDSTWKGRFGVNESGDIKWENTRDRPIYEYPVSDNEDVHGAIHIFEMPKKSADGSVQFGRYIAGYDPVDDDDDDKSRSLQSFFIMDVFTDRLVLEYSARTRYASEFYEQVRRALLFYNATVNYENQKKGFYGYMKNKNSLYLLADTPEILRDMDIQKTSRTGNKGKGTSANTAINSWAIDIHLEWLEAQAYNREPGVMNLNLIKSPAYLRELILYDGHRNADRISAIGMLLIYREDKRKIIQGAKERRDTPEASFGSKILKDIKKRRNSYNYGRLY